MSHVEDVQKAVLPKEQRVPKNKILMCVRVKESRNTSMQAQKILREFGLKEVNNCSFLMASDEVVKQLLLIKDFVAYGTPTKKLLNDIIRKRGYLKAKNNERVPITDNVLIEELLGDHGCICIEDVIDAFWKCDKQQTMYEECRKAIWPIQLAALKEDSEHANTKHAATGRELKKKTTYVEKGGYLGYMGDKINAFVEQII